MRVRFSKKSERALSKAPANIQEKFKKQLRLLLRDLRHPSLRAKKYSESDGVWQARIDDSWRFYFLIEGDTYYLLDIIFHPK